MRYKSASTLVLLLSVPLLSGCKIDWADKLNARSQLDSRFSSPYNFQPFAISDSRPTFVSQKPMTPLNKRANVYCIVNKENF